MFYIFTHSEAPNVCKPGTTGWVDWRRSTAQGSFPFGTVSVAFSIETPEYRNIEKAVKKYFKDRKLNGDWVSASVDEVIAFVQTIPQAGETNVE